MYLDDAPVATHCISKDVVERKLCGGVIGIPSENEGQYTTTHPDTPADQLRQINPHATPNASPHLIHQPTLHPTQRFDGW